MYTPANSALKHKLDSYNSVVIDSKALPSEELDFANQLSKSLKAWKQTEKKGVWLEIPREKAYLVPVATEMGFDFHHAKSGYVMLTTWLPGTHSKLPLGATHTLGVGGAVINEKNEILVVREKSGPVTSLWKMPGGRVDPGEEISDAAVREVLEETGVRTEFKSLVCFRHSLTGPFSNSDLYFIALLNPTSSEIVKQEEEIAEAKWMPLKEFVELPYYSKGLFSEIFKATSAAAAGKYSGLITTKHPVVLRPGETMLYHLPIAKL